MKSDRRAKYSEMLIRETYLEMLSEMPAEKITVTELCNRADLNRGTFYLHYRDCRELLETLGMELAEKQKARIEGMYASESALQQGMTELISTLFADDLNNRILFSNDKANCFDLILDYAKEKTLRSWTERGSLSPEQTELVYTFISGGGFSVAKAVYAGELDGGEETYHFMFELISRGLNSIIAKLPID